MLISTCSTHAFCACTLNAHAHALSHKWHATRYRRYQYECYELKQEGRRGFELNCEEFQTFFSPGFDSDQIDPLLMHHVVCPADAGLSHVRLRGRSELLSVEYGCCSVLDIDECATNSNNGGGAEACADSNLSCVNSVGSYLCE